MKINFNNPFNRKKERTSSRSEGADLFEINKLIEKLEEEKLEEEKNLAENLETLKGKDKIEKMLGILKLQKEKAEANYKKGDIERESRNEKGSQKKKEEKESDNKEPEVVEDDKVNETINDNEEQERGRSPEEKIRDFIYEYNLKNKMPDDFESLSTPRKMFVIEGIKKRLVDIVKTDAETQYSKELKQKLKNNLGNNKWLTKEIKEGLKHSGKALKESLAKETKIKNLESEIFKSLISSKEGEEILKTNLEILTTKSKSELITLSEYKNSPSIIYIDHGERNYTEEEKQSIAEFNDIANEFRNLPYEWGQERNSDRKIDYEKVKAKYEKAKSEILGIKFQNEAPGAVGMAMLEMSQIDGKVKMDQLLNTHPEFEKEFEKLGEEAGLKEKAKTAGRILNTLTGKNTTNRFLMGVGYAARGLSKGALAASKLDVFIAATTVAIGGTLGYFKGKIRGKDLVEKSKKDARHGNKESIRGVQVTDSVHLSQKLDQLTQKIEKATTKKEKEETMSMLLVRVEHTKGKIEKGQVNFGEAKSVLENQFNLITSLNNAVALSQVEKDSESMSKKIQSLLSATAKGAQKESSRAQKEFIWKQAQKGIVTGIGFASAGYAIRWLGEHVGWWGPDGGKHLTEKVPEKIDIPETKEEIVVPPIQEEIKAPDEYIDRGEDVDAPENDPVVDKPKIKKPTEKEPEDYETDNGWNKVTEEELKKQDELEKKDNLEDEPTTKVQGSKIVWTEGESGAGEVDKNTSRIQGSKITWDQGKSGGNSIDENTSKVQGSKIVWTEGESGKINETKIPGEETPEEIGKEEKGISHPTSEEENEIDETYEEPKGKMGPPTEEEMYEYQEPKVEEKTSEIEKEEEYVEPVTEDRLKQGEISNEKEEYAEPIKNIEKQPVSDIPNKIEYTEPEKEIPVNSENPYGLNETQLQEIKTINTENLSKVFGEKMGTWENIKVLPAHEDIESVGLTEQKQSFIKYLKKLREESGLEPRAETLVSKAETNEEYIKRVFAEMAKRGQLEKLKL